MNCVSNKISVTVLLLRLVLVQNIRLIYKHNKRGTKKVADFLEKRGLNIHQLSVSKATSNWYLVTVEYMRML